MFGMNGERPSGIGPDPDDANAVAQDIAFKNEGTVPMSDEERLRLRAEEFEREESERILNGIRYNLEEQEETENRIRELTSEPRATIQSGPEMRAERIAKGFPVSETDPLKNTGKREE